MAEETIVRMPKDPDDVMDYSYDFKPLTNGRAGAISDYLEEDETISSQTITAEAGITVDSDSEQDGNVTVWLSGGTAGQKYLVTCKIVTSKSRTKNKSIIIEVESE